MQILLTRIEKGGYISSFLLMKPLIILAYIFFQLHTNIKWDNKSGEGIKGTDNPAMKIEFIIFWEWVKKVFVLWIEIDFYSNTLWESTTSSHVHASICDSFPHNDLGFIGFIPWGISKIPIIILYSMHGIDILCVCAYKSKIGIIAHRDRLRTMHVNICLVLWLLF